MTAVSCRYSFSPSLFHFKLKLAQDPINSRDGFCCRSSAVHCDKMSLYVPNTIQITKTNEKKSAIVRLVLELQISTKIKPQARPKGSHENASSRKIRLGLAVSCVAMAVKFTTRILGISSNVIIIVIILDVYNVCSHCFDILSG